MFGSLFYHTRKGRKRQHVRNDLDETKHRKRCFLFSELVSSFPKCRPSLHFGSSRPQAHVTDFRVPIQPSPTMAGSFGTKILISSWCGGGVRPVFEQIRDGVFRAKSVLFSPIFSHAREKIGPSETRQALQGHTEFAARAQKIAPDFPGQEVGVVGSDGTRRHGI